MMFKNLRLPYPTLSLWTTNVKNTWKTKDFGSRVGRAFRMGQTKCQVWHCLPQMAFNVSLPQLASVAMIGIEEKSGWTMIRGWMDGERRGTRGKPNVMRSSVRRNFILRESHMTIVIKGIKASFGSSTKSLKWRATIQSKVGHPWGVWRTDNAIAK